MIQLSPQNNKSSLVVIHGDLESVDRELTYRDILFYGFPHRELPDEVRNWRRQNLKFLKRSLPKQLFARTVARKLGLTYVWSQLWLTVIRENGTRVPLGLAGCRVVTDVGAAFIVDAWQNNVELESMKYHGIGTDNTSEASTDTDLVSELTTEYYTNSTRATGTLDEGATANVFKTVGTNQVDSSVNIVEHGVFSNASVGSGVLIDRTVFTTVGLSSGDSLESTYQFTITSGS